MRLVADFVLISSLILAGCQSPFYADRGAALGGVTGALAGAAIGEHNGDGAAGALIGGAVGALSGAAIGDIIDQEVAQSQALIEQRMGRQMTGAVTIPDAIALSQAGLSDDVIMTHIRANGVAQVPQVADLITLRNAGVSDRIIQTLQQASPPAAPVVRPGGAPVIVEEHHYFGPTPWYPPHHPHHRHRGFHHGPGVHWGVSFGS